MMVIKKKKKLIEKMLPIFSIPHPFRHNLPSMQHLIQTKKKQNIWALDITDET